MQAEHALAPAEVGTLADVIPLQRSEVPLHICLLGYRSHPYGGGQGVYLNYLSKALVEAGHQVDVISGDPYPHLDERVKLIKMPSMNLYENGLLSMRPRHMGSWANWLEWLSKLSGGFGEPQAFGRRVVNYLEQHGRHYDVIHDNQSLSFGTLALQQRGFPLVTTIHHPITKDLKLAVDAARNFRERLLIRRWHSFLSMQKYVARRLHHVITVSKCSQRHIAQDFGIADERIDLVYCGIDDEVFCQLPDVPRVRYRIMATASADQPLKGLRYLLEAVAELAPRYPSLELLIVGKPKAGGATEKLIDKLNLGKQLRFVSGISTEEMVRYYNQAHVAVVPSLYEGFGLPAGEAMACGAPLVSSTGGALPEVVGDAGIQVPAGDSSAIAQAVERLFEDPALCEHYASAGRRRIENTFCWRIAAAQMVEYYHQMISENNENR